MIIPPLTWTVKFARKSWVIKDILEQGYTVGGKKFWKRYQCAYEGEFEGMPLLSSYQRDLGIYDNDEFLTERLLYRVRYEVTQIIPGPPDLSEFDVAQFLPPGVRVGEIAKAQLSPARIIAIVIGVVLIILGISSRVRKSPFPFTSPVSRALNQWHNLQCLSAKHSTLRQIHCRFVQ